MIKAFTCAALYALLISAAQCATINISSSVSCSTDEGTVTDPTSCNLAAQPTGQASATASSSYSILGNLLSVYLFDTASTSSILNFGVQTANLTASASSSMTLDLFTSGPLRSGFVLINGGFSDGGASTNAEASVQYLLSTSGGSVGLACGGMNEGGGCALRDGVLIPIALGTALDFSGNTFASATVNAAGAPLVASTGAQLNFGFELFEADGITPVDISLVAPEPSIVSLIGFALLLAGVGAFCLRSKSDKWN